MGLVWTATRRSLRGLRRSPSFTLGTVVTVGVSLGALGSVYTMVDRALLQPLPYEDADELVVLTETRRGERISTAYLNYLDWKEASTTVPDMGLFVPRSVTLTGEGPARRLRGVGAASDLFRVLRIEASRGRTLSPESDLPGGPAEIVLSHDLWQSAYGGDPQAVGRSALLDGVPHQVVGVMPEGFAFPDGIVFGGSDFLLSTGSQVDGWQDRSSHPGIYVAGRLAEGTTLEMARAEMTELGERLAEIHPENREEGIIVSSAKSELLGDLPEGLRLLAIAGGLVLLIGLVNALGLSTARAVTRQSEVQVARALGAGRRQLALEAVTDGLALGGIATIVSLLTANGILALFRNELAGLPRLHEVDVGVGTLVLLISGAVLGSVAVQLVARGGTLARGANLSLGRSTAGPSRRGVRVRTGLVGAQVALTVLLACGSGVLLRSFAALSAADGGLRAGGVLTLQIGLPAAEYEGDGRTATFYDQLFAEVGGIPGVEAIGGISTLPFSGAGAQSGIIPQGVELEGRGHRTDVNVVFEDYFDAMGIDLVSGRAFTRADGPGSPNVVVVDERFADRFWPSEDAVGKTISGWGLEDAQVVGVVRHVKNYGVAAESREELYMPHRQRPYLRMYVVVRASGDPASLSEPIRAAVAGIDPDVPISALRPMDTVVARTVSTPRLAARLGWALATVAGLLAFFGAYALIAHSVSRRTREMGLRMALGAGGRTLLKMVLGQGSRIAGAGVGLGLLAALAGADVLGSMVYGVSPRTPVVYVASASLVFLLALMASYLPARRAARTDPMEALRAE